MDRRDFLKTSTSLAAATTLGLSPSAAIAQKRPRAASADGLSFPKDFLWGTATASYQVEGAYNEDGRGPSIWDTFSHTPGKTHAGDTGDVADDFYHRYKEDIALMKTLGVKTFRMSTSWSRIFPTGAGKVNDKGLDFYKRVVAELRNAGIEPYVTLFHWDLPQALQDKYGGWANHDTAKVFADYAGFCAANLDVSHWMTINEFNSYVVSGYGLNPHFAPGIKGTKASLAAASHGAVLGHGMAVQAIRAHAKGKVKVGMAENVNGAMPAIDTPANIAAAKEAIRQTNAEFSTVIFEGKYTDAYLKKLGADAPKFTAEELKIISSPLDFLGVNAYSTNEVIASGNGEGFESIRHSSTYPRLLASWLYVNPQALYWTPKLLHEMWGINEMYITENGCSAEDKMTPDGRILDTDRVMFLRNYLTQLQRATSEGIPVKGYFLWSMLDNFEWAQGYSERFGITYVDFKTQKRTPKLSFEFYKTTIAKNAVA